MSGKTPNSVLALSGGVGGAKLVCGLADLLPAERLTVAANTGDDFEHLGLWISPDLDTIMYSLAGLSDRERGWGLAGETWSFMAQARACGAPDWFQLGDRDLATHVLRTDWLRRGQTLSEVTAELCRRLGVATDLVPMADEPVATILHSDAGPLEFQRWFVRERCAPAVQSVGFRGAEAARPGPRWFDRLRAGDFDAVVICPSNPFVSIGPILALPGVRAALAACRVPVVAVSPIIRGEAVKGPLAKMMREMNLEASAPGVARRYGDLLDGFVIDEADAGARDAIAATGVQCATAPTLMTGPAEKRRLAGIVLDFAAGLGAGA